MNLDKSLAR